VSQHHKQTTGKLSIARPFLVCILACLHWHWWDRSMAMTGKVSI
jgi:hypothetical protein